MGLAFTHLVSGWLFGKAAERLSKPFNQVVWAMLLFGAIVPDFDFFIEWTLIPGFHRTFTHSFVFIILSGMTAYATVRVLQSKQAGLVAFALVSGVITHIFVDSLLYPGVNLLWPLPMWFAIPAGFYYSTGIHLPLSQTPGIVTAFLIDTSLGLLWAGWLFLKGRLVF